MIANNRLFLFSMVKKLVCTVLMLSIVDISLFATRESPLQTKLTIQIEKKTLKDAVKKIEAQSEYLFFYNADEINENTIVSVKAENATINKVLDLLLRNTGIKYTVKNRHIVLAKADVKVKRNMPPNSSQGKKTVTGRVLDINGEPLLGATISIKGSKNRVVTDMDGYYTITVPEEISNPEISVTYIGYNEVSEKLDGRSDMTIRMRENQELLGEVVVVGYGTQKRESVTSAISVVGSEDISRSAATNTSGALVGKVAGINSRMSDGRPGNWTTLNIRNMGTPLYVVDGVQMEEGQFNNIDFNDIESISVLKDGSASIYGVRAANGVVVVTTKSGRRNMPNTVNINMYYGWQHIFRFPKPASAESYVESEIQSNTIQGTQGKFTVEDLTKWKQGTEKGYIPFDWYDYVFVTSPQWYVSANTTGGSEKINYYLALSHMNQDAVIRNYGYFGRTNIQANIDANITSNFKVGASINGRIQETKHPGVAMNDDYWTAMYAVYANLPTVHPYANDNPNYPAQTSSAGYTNSALLTYDRGGVYVDRWKVLQTTFNAEWEPVKNLKIKGIFSYYYSNRRMDNQEYSYKLYDYNEKTDSYSVVLNSTGRFKERDIRNIEELNGQINASYKFTIEGHSVNLFAGAESYKRNTPGFYIQSSPTSNALTLFYLDNIKQFNDEGDNTQARLGYVGRINYDYKSKYLLELAARYDGSWKFPKGHRWGFFPSVSAGWRVSEESFWSESNFSDIFSDLKVRASYGEMGDDNVSGYNAFDFLDGYNYSKGGAVIDGEWVVGSQARNLAVTNLSWIKAKIVDVGLDVGFFNGKLTGAIDYFRRMRTGLPASRYDKLVPSEAGFSLPYENLNSDLTTGFDGSLIWRDKVGKVEYSIGGNFTFARQLNWHQYKPRFGNSLEWYVYSQHERNAGWSFTYQTDGQFQSWEEIANYPIDIDGKGNTTLRPGDLKYKDNNKDGIIDDQDQRPTGYQGYDSSTPPYLNYAINGSLAYRGFDLSFDFTGSAFATFFFNYEQRFPFHGDRPNPEYYLSDQWHLSDITNPDSELIPGTFPTVLMGNSNHSNYKASDFWMRNVRYLKLRNLEFGYTFPDKWMKKMHVKKLRVYTLMQNLFSIDNVHDRGIDPEIYSASAINYPTNRVINFGLTLTL